MSTTKSLHYELCCKAGSWIRQANNREPWRSKYMFSVVELVCIGCELTDVYAANGEISAIIEVKTSHSDFIRDKDKVSRRFRDKAMGNYRYYLCPEGIIKPEELPDNWGLLYYKDGKITKIIQAEYVDSNLRNEIFIFASIMRREGLSNKTFNYRKSIE